MWTYLEYFSMKLFQVGGDYSLAAEELAAPKEGTAGVLTVLDASGKISGLHQIFLGPMISVELDWWGSKGQFIEWVLVLLV